MGQIRALTFLLLSQAFILLSANPLQSDSIPDIELKEVEVEAQMQRTDARMTTYIPSAVQKKAAQTAPQLLAAMAIPQIRVNPADGSVRSIAGNNVAIFINMIPASQDDLNGMNIANVRKVEYLEHPTDPRFRNAPAVINFVMVRYEWGGYTKLSPGFSQGSATKPSLGVYSKFAYGKMIYDVSTAGAYTRSSSLGSDRSTTYRLSDYLGNGPAEISQRQEVTSGELRRWSENLNFRAMYATDDCQISNTVSLNFMQEPRANITSTTTYDNPLLKSGLTASALSSYNRNYGWDCEIFKIMPRQWIAVADLKLLYSDADSKWKMAVDDEMIINEPKKEHAWEYGIEIAAQKAIAGKHMIGPFASWTGARNKVDYTGDAAAKLDYNSNLMSAGIVYRFNMAKWTVGALAGWSGLWSSVNHSSTDFMSQPEISVNGSYSPSRRHQFNVNVEYKVNPPSSAMRNPTLVQDDQLLWHHGNAAMKNSPGLRIDAGYTWLPSNAWQLSVAGRFSRRWNRWASEYVPEGPEGAMLAVWFNSGKYDYAMATAMATFKALNNHLILNAGPQVTHYAVLADASRRLTSAYATVNAYLYLGNIYIQPYYNSPSKSLNAMTGARVSMKSTYGVTVGWGNGRLNVSATASNFARWSDLGDRTELTTKWIDRVTQSRQGLYHATFKISATYTFDYGKKLSHDDEIKSTRTPTSAIL